MPINKNELTKEQFEKAMKCRSADELMALAKAEGFAITKDEAEAYLTELADAELDEKMAKIEKSKLTSEMIAAAMQCSMI